MASLINDHRPLFFVPCCLEAGRTIRSESPVLVCCLANRPLPLPGSPGAGDRGLGVASEKHPFTDFTLKFAFPYLGCLKIRFLVYFG